MSSSLFGEYPNYPSQKTIQADLMEQAYARVPFAMGDLACQELFDNFAGFVELYKQPGGEQLKAALKYKVNDLGNGGYHFEYRQPGSINLNELDRNPGTDHKYIFHYGPQTIERAKAKLGGCLPDEMQVFLDNCDEFYEAGTKVLRVGAAALGLEGSMFHPDRNKNVHLLRLLDYLASPDESLGEVHFDRAAMSAALSENKSGLRGAGGQNGYLEPVTEHYLQSLRDGLEPLDHQEYEAKFFLGAGFNRLPEHLRKKHKDLPLLAHDINNDNPGEPRHAVVIFGNPHQDFVNYTVPSKLETDWTEIVKQASLQVA